MPHKLAVFGNPINHSRSPAIHAMFAEEAGIDLTYERILVPTGDFRQVADAFLGDGGLGFNITVPCKGDAFEYVNYHSDTARISLAVNTVYRRDDGSIGGDNTDGDGLRRDIEDNLGWNLEGKRILVAGAGGAVRGVLPALLAAEPARIDISNRTHATAQDLASLFENPVLRAVTADECEQTYDLVINGTSAGLGGEVPSLPRTVIGAETRIYDMVYGAGVTSFNQWARDLGANQTADGLGMLVEQAASAFKTWFPNNNRPQTPNVIATLRTQLT